MNNLLKDGLKIFSVVILMLVIGFACKKNRFKKDDFLTDIYAYKIEPEIKASVNTIADFKTVWNNFNAHNSPANFTLVQSSFIKMSKSIEIILCYNFGDVAGTYTYSRFYKTGIDTIAIKTLYNEHEVFNANEISSYTNTQKGEFAIAYLLFGETFQDSINLEKYQNFVSAHIDYFGEAVAEMQNNWSIYEKNFTENKQDGVSDVYNILINRIIHLTEELIAKRIEDPLESGNPNSVIGAFTKTGMDKIKTQVQSLNDIYYGHGTTEFNSIYNNIRKKKKKLADEIGDKFSELITKGTSMDGDLSSYITDDSTELLAYKSLLIELLTLFKVDVQEELDIIITFGDTDGD